MQDNLNDTFNESWMPIGMSSVDHLANISKERSGCEMTDSPNLQLEEDNEEAASSEPAMKACPRLWSEEVRSCLLCTECRRVLLVRLTGLVATLIGRSFAS